MILTIDIGNTDTKAASFSLDGKILGDTREPSQGDFLKLPSLLETRYEKIVISTVVPARLEKVLELVNKKSDCVHVASEKSPWSFAIETEQPEKTGHDRLANLEGAIRFGAYAIVIDAGTATKLDVLEGMEKKRFPGGVIAPGVGISFEALLAKTAQLPRIELDKHSPVIGYNTETAMRSGVVHGFAAMVDGMVMRIFEERKLPMQTAVIATGGFSKFLSTRARLVTHFAPKLSLEGLYALSTKL